MLKALLIHVGYGTWGQEYELKITPFPGLGIRLDTYDMVNVVSVIVGDPDFHVTCIVEKEGAGESLQSKYLSEEDCERLGFENWNYP